MTTHLLHHPRSVRLPDPYGGRDERLDEPKVWIINDHYVVQTRSSKGYFYLRLPHDRDPDGTIVATWLDDALMTHQWEVERDVRPTQPRRFAVAECG